MITDTDLGGRKEVITNDNKYVVSNANKIVLSLQRYLGNIFPKIRHLKIDNYIDINLRTREYL